MLDENNSLQQRIAESRKENTTLREQLRLIRHEQEELSRSSTSQERNWQKRLQEVTAQVSVLEETFQVQEKQYLNEVPV